MLVVLCSEDYNFNYKVHVCIVKKFLNQEERAYALVGYMYLTSKAWKTNSLITWVIEICAFH